MVKAIPHPECAWPLGDLRERGTLDRHSSAMFSQVRGDEAVQT